MKNRSFLAQYEPTYRIYHTIYPHNVNLYQFTFYDSFNSKYYVYPEAKKIFIEISKKRLIEVMLVNILFITPFIVMR